MKKPNQRQRLIQAFKENGNVLTLPQILSLRPRIAQYGTRIKELKEKDGYVIENVTWNEGGERHSKYILISEPKKAQDILPTSPPQNFPSNAYKIAHENRMKKEREKEVLTGQSSLF